MQIAIDGPAGVGKSTIAKLLANELNYLYLDTGAMYRAIAYAALKNNIDLEKDIDRVHELVDNYKINFKDKKVYLDNEDVTEIIRSKDVTNVVSIVAADEKVREKLVKLQQEIAGNNDIVMDGRDVGSVILPNAEVKFYMDATPLLRAKRRAKDLNIDINDLEKIEELKNIIIERDRKDSNRSTGALKRTDDAHYIETDDMTIPEVLNKLLTIVNGEQL